MPSSPSSTKPGRRPLRIVGGLTAAALLATGLGLLYGQGTWSPHTARPPSADGFPMPAVVSQPLPGVQSTLSALDLDVTATDVTGRHRTIDKLPLGWRVCTQDPPPDTPVTPGTKVTLGAAMVGELCGPNDPSLSDPTDWATPTPPAESL